MRFSKTELKVLEQIALGARQVSEVAAALNKDRSQVYRIVRSLHEKGFAELEHREIRAFRTTHVQLLLQELGRQPSFIGHLSGCGVAFYTFILEPKTMDEIIKETGIKRSTAFYKIRKALRNSFIRQTGSRYQFNGRFWPKVGEFLVELRRYEETNDKRAPPGAVIYYRSEDDIVFSTRAECDAALTGFSAYGQFGIRLSPVDNTYYLPKRKLTKQEVFLHSVYRAQKDGGIRHLIFVALFYIKHKKDLAEVKGEMIDNINRVLRGERVKNYPSLAEIRERAEVYDIKV